MELSGSSVDITVPDRLPDHESPNLGQRFSTSRGAMELIRAEGQESYYQTDLDVIAFAYREVEVQAAVDSDKVRSALVLSNSLSFAQAGTTNYMKVSKRGSHFVGARLDPAIREEIEAEFGGPESQMAHAQNICGGGAHQVGTLFWQFMNEGYFGGSLAADSILTLAMVQIALARKERDPLPHMGGMPRTGLDRVKEYIEYNMTEDLKLDQLASVAAMSRFHFARRFKEETGKAPHQYVMERRVARAKVLLAESSFPISQIAHMCRFSDQSHMTAVFTRLLGVTPAKYRRSVKL